MKRISYIIIAVLTIFIFNIYVNAASANLSVSSNSAYVGDTFTVSVNVSSSAAWNIHVSSSGPVSGCSIVQADATADALDTNKTFTASCTATSEGVVTISLSGDVTSALDGNAVGISESKTVSISKRPTTPTTPTTPSTPTTPTNPNQNTNNNNNKEEKKEDKSKNNNLKDISVDGYNLTKVDNNNYTLSVSNDVASINIKASAEDSKAKLTGDGKHDIKVGDNNIELTITSESGDVNKINIKVTRKDAFYLDDIDNALKSNNDINININSDSRLSSQDLTKIKNSGKEVKLNYYDENKELLYSWILDGSKINDFDELLTKVSFKSENEKEIKKLSNYADGIYVSLSNKGKIPSGTKLRIKVKDKYSDKDKVNVYYYDKDKLTVVKEGIEVKDGYIECDVKDNNDYFITMSKINNSVKVEKSNNTSIILLVALSVILICIIAAIILFILKNRKKKEKDSNVYPINYN